MMLFNTSALELLHTCTVLLTTILRVNIWLNF